MGGGADGGGTPDKSMGLLAYPLPSPYPLPGATLEYVLGGGGGIAVEGGGGSGMEGSCETTAGPPFPLNLSMGMAVTPAPAWISSGLPLPLFSRRDFTAKNLQKEEKKDTKRTMKRVRNLAYLAYLAHIPHVKLT
jgi:hypothetical protein